MNTVTVSERDDLTVITVAGWEIEVSDLGNLWLGRPDRPGNIYVRADDEGYSAEIMDGVCDTTLAKAEATYEEIENA